MVLGPELGADTRKKVIIVSALYGLKSSGAAFRNHLADCMCCMGYKSCMSYPYLWLNPKVIQSDGSDYYSYILCYVNDILCIHHDSMAFLNKLYKYSKLKLESAGDLDMYLGAKLWQIKLRNGVFTWGMSPSKFVCEATKHCAKHVKDTVTSR